jgi:propionyl-CoA carboxylase alpha chain
VELGSAVGVEFDPMLAKVISHAPSRDEAAGRLALALERSRIRGVTTNRDFLVATLRHEAFRAGDTTTDFIERTGASVSRIPTADELRLAAVAAALYQQHEARSRSPVLPTLPSGWRNSVMPPQKRAYAYQGRELEVTYRRQRDGTFAVGDNTVRLLDADEGWVTLEVDGAHHRVHVATSGDRIWVQGPDGDVALRSIPRLPDGGGGGDVAGGLLAPMPGKVLSVAVGAGDLVEAGQLLLILEAMKMEHRVVAPASGVVVSVGARQGEQVQGGDLLVVLEEAP